MLKIRLIRLGKKNAPFYRVVLTEHTAPPQGKFLEALGSYNPKLKEIVLNKDRILYWLSCGAQASATVHNLLIKEGVITGKKMVKKIKIKKKEEAKTEEPKKESADKAEAVEEKPVEEKKEEKPVEVDKKEDKKDSK